MIHPRFGLVFRISALLIFLGGPWAATAFGWETLTGCRLVEEEYFDGDSFHVRAGGRDQIFRLYAVDAPETNDDFAQRVNEQKKYFGTTKKNVLAAGKEAGETTRQLLKSPFAVETKWVDAKGNSKQPRYFAKITLSDGSDLGLRLVEAGLARSYGMREGMTAAYLSKLDRAQEEAKKAGRGVWAPKPSPDAQAPGPSGPKRTHHRGRTSSTRGATR